MHKFHGYFENQKCICHGKQVKWEINDPLNITPVTETSRLKLLTIHNLVAFIKILLKY